jgi:O-antigen/teichoic acid export membrane protein
MLNYAGKQFAAPRMALGQSMAAVQRFCARLTNDAMLQKSVISIVDQAVVSAMNFGVTILLSRCTGKAEVGLYYLALQIVFFMRGIQEQLIAAPYYIYSGRQSKTDLTTYSGSSLLHELLLLAIAASALAVASLLGFCSPALNDVLILLVVAAPMLMLREFIRQMMFAELRVGEALRYDLAVVACQTAGLALAWWFESLSTLHTYTMLALGCALPSLIWVFEKRGSFVLKLDRAWNDWHSNWTFARWALATQLLGCSMPFVIPWVVATQHGAEATSALGVGTTLIGIANMFVLGMSNFVCPQAARAYAAGGKTALWNILSKAALLYVLVLGSFALAMLFQGNRFMSLVYGPLYAESGTILAILAFGSLANSLGIVAGNGLWAMERPAANFRADVLAMLTWILATYFFVTPWGAYGAACASTLGIVVSAMVRLITLKLETSHAKA